MPTLPARLALLPCALALACGTPTNAPTDVARDDASSLDAPAPDAPAADTPAADTPSGDTPAVDAPAPDAAPPGCALPTILDGFVPRRTLYVAPAGRDTNDGLTPATAWATLSHAAAYRPGDDVRVAPGAYPCPFLANVRGTAAAPIRIAASGAPRSAVLDCAAGGGSVLLSHVAYVAFEGLEVRNARAGHCINLASGDPPYTNLSEHVLFRGLYVHDCQLSGIKASQAFELDVRGCEVARNTAAGNPLINFVAVHDARVVGNDVHDGVSEGIQAKGGAYDVLVEGNRVHDVGDTCVNLGQDTGDEFYLPGYGEWEARRAMAVNNLLYGRMRSGVSVWGCEGCVVAHNTMWAEAPAFFVRGLGTDNASRMPVGVVRLVLANNVFASRAPPGVPLNLVASVTRELDQGHNLYYSPGGRIAGRYSDTPIGGPGNLVDVDPRFVNAAAASLDLRLAPGSPALGAGRSLASAPRAFGGACRTARDLGAW